MKDPSRTDRKLIEEISALKSTVRKLEEALCLSEEKYRSIFKNAVEGIFQTTPEGRFLNVNPSYAKIFGYSSPEELTGGDIDIGSEIYANPDDRTTFRQLMDEQGMVQGLEILKLKKDKTPLWVSFNARVVKDTSGATLYYEGTVEDITPRKLAEEELKGTLEKLKKSEATLSSAINASNESLMMVDHRGSVLLSNTIGAQRLGLSVPELVGTCLYDHLPPDTARLREGWLDAVFKTGEPAHFEDMTAGRYFESHYYPIADEEGKVSRAAIFARDITEHRQADEELKIAIQRLFDIIEFLPEATFVIDEEKTVVAWNRACEEMTGVKKEEVMGKGDYAYAIPFYGERRPMLIDYVTMDPDVTHQGYTSMRRKGHTLHAEAFLPILSGGKGVFLSGNASPLFDREGKVVGVIESVRDITELKHLETQLRQSQKMESIGTLAGGIAHDFNNILTSLMGYTSLIQVRMDKGDPMQAYVDQILSASRKAADLIGSLLTFSRKQPVTLVPLDVNETIKVTKKLLKRLLTEDIELRTSLAKDETIVMADRSQLDQILFNLITNARDAMPKGGGISIETSIADIDEGFVSVQGFGNPGRYILLSVSDTGTGMDDSTLEKIFDPFFTTKETGKGTGLGLATVYGIVKQHNGYITAHSELGHGTTFRIYLPAVGVRVLDQHHETAPVGRGSETILIAEDDGETRRFMNEALKYYGYKTIEAVDGEDAVDKFMQHRGIDLVIVDSVMPKKNGREVYEAIRATDPHIKVLFTSGYTKDIVLDKGIQDREFDFITKPLSLDKLLQKIREVLDR